MTTVMATIITTRNMTTITTVMTNAITITRRGRPVIIWSMRGSLSARSPGAK